MEPFTDQKIFIGIDVHKKSWSVSVFGEYNMFKTFTQPPSSLALERYLLNNFAGADFYAVYEAGFCGFSIYNDLNSLGIKTIIVNPADVPISDKEKKQKSDAVDSRKLARSLRAGELTAIYVPQDETLNDRSILRYRNKLVGDQTRCKNRIKGFLYFNGIEIPEQFDGTKWGKGFVGWLSVKAKSYWALEALIDQLLYIQEALKKVNRQLLEISKKDAYNKQFELIKSIPGLGTLSAIHVLLEIEDISRFKTNNQLASFVGLTPIRHASGESEWVGPMTPRGNKQLKKYLIEASWIVVRRDPEMMAAFGKLCKRMIKTKAIIRIARKILNRIKAVLESGQPYEINYNLVRL